MSQAEQAQLRISDLIETSFDDIETPPDFITPVPGSYIVQTSQAELKDADKEKPYIYILFHLVRAIEPEAAIEQNYPEGSPISVRYYGKTGAGNLKKAFADVIAQLGCANLAQFLDMVVGTELGITVTNRKDKETDKVYMDLKTAVMTG